MNLAPDDTTPAPRTVGDPIAMRAAYTSGHVFSGRLNVPAIDGDRDTLLARICDRYQLPRQAAEWQVSAWQNAYTDRWLYGSRCELH